MSIEMTEEEQKAQWDKLYNEIARVLSGFGVENAFGKADYLIVDDYFGWRRHTVEIHKLHMLRLSVVAALQALLDGFAEWEIVVAVDLPGKETDWPPMGLTITKKEITGDLKREYLPPEYRSIVYDRASSDR